MSAYDPEQTQICLARRRAKKPKQYEPLEICRRESNQSVRNEKDGKSHDLPTDYTSWNIEKMGLPINSVTKDGSDDKYCTDEHAAYWINARD